jgi:hypothetical protein
MWKWFSRFTWPSSGNPIGLPPPAARSSPEATKRALQGGPDCQILTVCDLLDWFVSLVVSGAGFSREQSREYFHGAALALGVPPRVVAHFNLGDMRQLSVQERQLLDKALFNQDFVSYAAGHLSKQRSLAEPRPKLPNACQWWQQLTVRQLHQLYTQDLNRQTRAFQHNDHPVELDRFLEFAALALDIDFASVNDFNLTDFSKLHIHQLGLLNLALGKGEFATRVLLDGYMSDRGE